jgi:hypothetical protein
MYHFFALFALCQIGAGLIFFGFRVDWKCCKDSFRDEKSVGLQVNEDILISKPPYAYHPTLSATTVR